MRDEELIQEMLKIKTLIALYMQPRGPDSANKNSANAISDPHVFDDWISKASPESRAQIIDFFNGLKKFFYISRKNEPPEFNQEKYREYVLSIQRLIKANLFTGEFVEGNTKFLLEFLSKSSNKKLTEYLKENIHVLTKAHTELMRYLQDNNIKYLPKKGKISSEKKETAERHLENAREQLLGNLSKTHAKVNKELTHANLQGRKNASKELSTKLSRISTALSIIPERSRKIKHINSLTKLTNTLKSEFENLLQLADLKLENSLENSKEKKLVLEKIYAIIGEIEKKYPKSRALQNFCNTPFVRKPVQASENLNEAQEQFPLILALAKIKTPTLNKILKGYSDIKADLKREGSKYLIQAIKQNDPELVKVLLRANRNLNIFTEFNNESPFDLAQKSPALLKILDDHISYKFMLNLDVNLHQKYYANKGGQGGPFYSYKNHRDAQIKFLSDIQKELRKTPHSREEKMQIYLGALHYIEALLLAEHPGGELNWRFTDTKSRLEKIVETEIKHIEQISEQPNPNLLVSSREAFDAFIKDHNKIENDTLNRAYKKCPLKKRQDIYQTYMESKSGSAPRISDKSSMR